MRCCLSRLLIVVSVTSLPLAAAQCSFSISSTGVTHTCNSACSTCVCSNVRVHSKSEVINDCDECQQTFTCDSSTDGECFDSEINCASGADSTISTSGDVQRLFESSIINCESAASLIINADARQRSFDDCTINAPNNGGDFVLNVMEQRFMESGSINAQNSGTVTINVFDYGGNDDFTYLDLDASNADKVIFRTDSSGTIDLGRNDRTFRIYCPDRSDYSSEARCEIDLQGTVTWPDGSLGPLKVYAKGGKPGDVSVNCASYSNCQYVQILCGSSYTRSCFMSSTTECENDVVNGGCEIPTPQPTAATDAPSEPPTAFPSASPIALTGAPTNPPTSDPTGNPTQNPTSSPSAGPTIPPTQESNSPTQSPAMMPTELPTLIPTSNPSSSPATSEPSSFPSPAPTALPSELFSDSPTSSPNEQDSRQSNGSEGGISDSQLIIIIFISSFSVILLACCMSAFYYGQSVGINSQIGKVMNTSDKQDRRDSVLSVGSVSTIQLEGQSDLKPNSKDVFLPSENGDADGDRDVENAPKLYSPVPRNLLDPAAKITDEGKKTITEGRRVVTTMENTREESLSDDMFDRWSERGDTTTVQTPTEGRTVTEKTQGNNPDDQHSETVGK